MKKMFVIAMSAAALLSAAPMTASACDQHWTVAEPANVRVTVRLTKEELSGDARFDQTVRVTDTDCDGFLESLDAVASALYACNPTAKYAPYENGCIWGQEGRFRITVTDGSGKQELGYMVNEISDYTLSDGLWVHVEPLVSGVDVYALEPVNMDPLHMFEFPYEKGDTVTLRTVKYPAGDFKPVPVPFAEILIDGQHTGMMTCADGTATISLDQADGLHELSAYFRNATVKDTVIGSHLYNVFDNSVPYFNTKEYENHRMDYLRSIPADVTTAPAMTTTAAETTTTTAAVTSATTAVTTAAESTTAASETAAVITTAAESTSAPAATTVSTTAAAKQTSATGSTKAGSLQTGDSMPVAALLFAGFAAAGSAVMLSRKRKDD